MRASERNAAFVLYWLIFSLLLLGWRVVVFFFLKKLLFLLKRLLLLCSVLALGLLVFCVYALDLLLLLQ